MSVTSKTFRTFGVAAALGIVSIGGVITMSSPATAAQEINIVDGYALHGYDPVAYFTIGTPTPGSSEFVADYDGATYRFASAENRDLFNQDPEHYAPQYGGFCAFGTAMGRKFDGDPTAWRIVDSKLYLNLNKQIQERWLVDIPGFIRGANHNWEIIEPIEDGTLANEASAPAGLTIGAQ
ncbi:YHS domain-containing (seleno)protein [Thalassospira lucentensis]|uniref:YHS domain-containing (seleno)protein n=1 Tax=Thalassospira lucentensis TaxID=168935 RepID=UPI003D2EB6AB